MSNLALTKVCFDSRNCEPDCLFVAVRGVDVDGHDYILKAISAGARVIVCEEFPKESIENVTYVKVKNSSKALGILASNFYDNPSEEIQLVGITGTNGKTTVATLLFDVFSGLNFKVGLISTVNYRIGNTTYPSTHTTPDVLRINELLREMVNQGCRYCFMEVSSHALDQNRTHGLNFDGGIFTNISRDHLDYHGDFNTYIKAKKRFFDQLDSNAFALVNSDDKHAPSMLMNTKARQKSYSLNAVSDYRAKILESHFDGTLVQINGIDIYTRLIGKFNVYNVLAVFAVSEELGVDQLQVLTILSCLQPVKGRFEQVRSENGIVAIIDYAHTPDALKNVLETIQSIRTNDQKVYCVVGCGGDRDTGKRPQMAKIAVNLSDQVILTSDNPRTEDPMGILADMENGLSEKEKFKALSIVDRRAAIKTVVRMASQDDIILVAGKGHEDYQEIHGVKHHFDDMEEVIICFKALEN